MRSVQVYDGQPFDLPGYGRFRLVCCDCGLTHGWSVEVLRYDADLDALVPITGEKLVLRITAIRDNRSTAQRRRHNQRVKVS